MLYCIEMSAFFVVLFHPQCGVPPTPEAPLKLPQALAPSASSLDASGVFLLDDGLTITIWIGASVNPKVTESLFGPHVSQSTDLAQVSRSLRPPLHEVPAGTARTTFSGCTNLPTVTD